MQHMYVNLVNMLPVTHELTHLWHEAKATKIKFGTESQEKCVWAIISLL